MKVGILTLMHGYNYGGILQCYSLCKVLRHLGYEVSVIDFHPSKKQRMVRQYLAPLGSVGKWVHNAGCSLRYGRVIHGHFDTFRRSRLQLTVSCNTRQQLCKLIANYDAVITGSDQVWNIGWLTPEYFLDFAVDLPVKTISYASCFGSGEHNLKEYPEIIRWISGINSVSVRNEMSASKLTQAGLPTPPVVCDPTLLVDVPELEQEDMGKLIHGKYVLLYGLSEKRLLNAQLLLNEIKAQSGLPLVGIKNSVLQAWTLEGASECLCDPSVEQWVSLIKNASFVLTDSFHGMLFALKYSIPFINYIGKDHGFERVFDAVERYEIQGAFPTDIRTAYSEALAINFNRVNKKIACHRQASLDFLKKALCDGF